MSASGSHFAFHSSLSKLSPTNFIDVCIFSTPNGTSISTFDGSDEDEFEDGSKDVVCVEQEEELLLTEVSSISDKVSEEVVSVSGGGASGFTCGSDSSREIVGELFTQASQ